MRRRRELGRKTKTLKNENCAPSRSAVGGSTQAVQARPAHLRKEESQVGQREIWEWTTRITQRSLQGLESHGFLNVI